MKDGFTRVAQNKTATSDNQLTMQIMNRSGEGKVVK